MKNINGFAKIKTSDLANEVCLDSYVVLDDVKLECVCQRSTDSVVGKVLQLDFASKHEHLSSATIVYRYDTDELWDVIV